VTILKAIPYLTSNDRVTVKIWEGAGKGRNVTGIGSGVFEGTVLAFK
jgi:hypothetical protein